MDIFNKLNDYDDMLGKLTYLNEVISKDTMETISRAMRIPEIQRYVQFTLSKIRNKEYFSPDEIQTVSALVKLLQSIYNYSGEDTGVSDSEFDMLYELLRSYNEDIITTPVLGDNVAFHKYKSLRGTLEKIYALSEDEDLANGSRQTLQEWVARCERILYEKSGFTGNLWDTEIYVFPKWDGVSVEFEFEDTYVMSRALTRGNTETNEGEDVTFIFKRFEKQIGCPSMKGPYGKKTEVMMTEKDFDRINKASTKKYKNTRSIVSSIITSDEIDDKVNYLDVVGLRTSTFDENGEETLQKLDDDVFNRPYLKCRLRDIDAIRNFAHEHTYVNGLRCDGAVIYIIDEKIQKLLGRENHKNKFEVAYKFNEEVAYTKIKNIEFNTGLFGHIAPRANFEPVKMKGNTISYVSLGSIARMKELGLAKGDTVKILYEIIPYLVFDENDPKCIRSGKKPIEPPTTCSECGHELVYSEKGGIYSCVNKKCGWNKRGKIINYLQKMDIAGISYATVQTLYDFGFLEDITDLYKLKKHKKELMELDGFGEASVTQIIDAIDSKRKVYDYVLFGSLGIEGNAKKTFRKVFNVMTLDDVMDYAKSDKPSAFAEIQGISDISAMKIVEGIKENKDIIKFLKKELTILHEDPTECKFIVAFTKVRSDALVKEIEKRGGIVGENCTKNTTFLITKDKKTTSTSVTKAKKYGIPIVPIDDVIEWMDENIG